MKFAAKILSFAAISAALVFTGCTKKPTRPSPGDTVPPMGQAINAPLAPQDVPSVADAGSSLQQRPDGVIETADQIRGLLKPVYFDFDKSAIKASERVKLDEAAKYIAEHPEHRLLLEGHCDWRGTAEYNLGLGDRRAGAAKQYLQTRSKLDATKVETLSKGSLEATKNASEEQMGKDRRVEIVILKK